MTPKIRAGDLRDVIDIYFATIENGTDGGQEIIIPPAPSLTVRGKTEFMSVARKFEGGGVVKEATLRVFIRWNEEILVGSIFSPVRVSSLGVTWELIAYTPVEHGVSAYLWLREIA